jgi:hypothetical protein
VVQGVLQMPRQQLQEQQEQQTQVAVLVVVQDIAVRVRLAALALSSSLTLAHKYLLVEQSHLLVATLFTHLTLAVL